ncbi:MAG: hypothetical protein R2854_19515 [Caldilineaceae bacterium]
MAVANAARKQFRHAVVMLHHPPLYYLLAAPILCNVPTLLIGHKCFNFNPHFVCQGRDDGWRVMLPVEMTGLGSGTVASICSSIAESGIRGLYPLVHLPEAQGFCSWSRWAPLAASAVACLNPSFVYMASTFHHDILLALLESSGNSVVPRSTAVGSMERTIDRAGALSTAAILTKMSGLTILALIVVALVLSVARKAFLAGCPKLRL